MRLPALLLITTLAVPTAHEHFSPAQHLPPARTRHKINKTTPWVT